MINERECYLCRTLYGICTTHNLHRHHAFEGGTSGRRKMSDKYDLVVWLCGAHHNQSNEGVHFNRENDLIVKRYAQTYYEEHYGSRDDFRRDFIKSYL